MKKHKSVVAILLAVMMIFAMMPSMAFAAKATGWGDKCATVTDEDGKTFKTVRAFDTATGLTAAHATNEPVEAVVDSGAVTPAIPDDGHGNDAVRYFYDLNGAVIAFDGITKPLDGTTWSQAAFPGLKDRLGIKVLGQEYAKDGIDGKEYKDMNATEKAAFAAFVTDLNGRKVEFEVSDYDATKKTEDQKITVTAKITVDVPTGTVIDGSEDYPELEGAVASATITVKGEKLTPRTAQYYFDTVGGVAIDDGIYDGAAHTVVADAVDGWTVAYQVYNATTGKYEDASAVTITDVQKEDMNVIAVWTKTGTTTVDKIPLYVNLAKADGATVGFDAEASIDDDDFVYSVPGEKYNTADYIAVTPFAQSTKGADTAEGKAEIRRQNAANKAAVAANEALIKEYFNALYEVNAKTTKTNINPKLTVNEKELTAKEIEEIGKKYATLLNNFNLIDIPTSDEDATYYAYVLLNGEVVLDYEVEFTKAPAGVTVFKANKKGKLAKNKSIKVKAVSNLGEEITYKLVNANSKITINKKTGKITVKKGLKKGTYTFKVKAYVAGHADNAEGWFEYQTIKVKIKK